MPEPELHSLPLDVQLRELEHTYAECIIDADAKTLAGLWNRIKEIRTALSIPIYNNVTPKDQRV